MKNIILNVDSYKTSHYLQYPNNTQYVSSYIESRGGRFPWTLFFGLQAFIKRYLLNPITSEQIEEAEQVLTAHGMPFNRDGWEYILKRHDGYLPLEISAVAEGSVIPTRNILAQVVNTDPKCAWLTSYIETALLRAVWYPTTVATLSYACKRAIRANMLETADSLEGLPFKLHDFGARGVSSMESAALGGLAHLVNFQGTDTLSAVLAARDYYQESMAGFSVPAAEHSTITCWGRENEAAAYANMLNRFSGDGKTVAVVSDSYDLWEAIRSIWGGSLKENVINQGGTVVIRPDSGDPVRVVSDCIELLMSCFGERNNRKGYRVLPDYVRVIQGDGINLDSLQDILDEMQHRRLSSENIAFGMGGALLQKLDRDTQRFAMKASAVYIDGQWRDVYKKPATDPGKASKPGRLALIRNQNGEYQTISKNRCPEGRDLLRTIYRNGELIRDVSMAEVRANADRYC